mmetsp:Transcript_31282/g.99797  ORF Transcript_31282/g.99797 Transcript_31282/m.99797 type:complete len:253 (+) Transcript_31282:29-787(+)
MTICLYANINPGAAPGRGALHFARQPAFCASAATPALFIRTCRLPSSPSAPLKEGIARKGFSPAPDEHPSRSQISASATLSLAFSSSALLALESRAASVSPTAARAALHSTRWSRMRCPSSSIAARRRGRQQGAGWRVRAVASRPEANAAVWVRDPGCAVGAGPSRGVARRAHDVLPLPLHAHVPPHPRQIVTRRGVQRPRRGTKCSSGSFRHLGLDARRGHLGRQPLRRRGGAHELPRPRQHAQHAQQDLV